MIIEFVENEKLNQSMYGIALLNICNHKGYLIHILKFIIYSFAFMKC